MTSYFADADEIRDLAATLPGMTSLLAKSDDELVALALLASIDIDVAMRYQGRKYDLGDGTVSGTVGVPQAREFPRVHDELPISNFRDRAMHWPLASGTSVWDWDPAANEGAGGPVVPDLVKIACLYQAAWLLNPANAERLAAIRAGLAAQSTASLSETYRTAAELAAMAGGGALDARAANIMDTNYRLRSGRIQ